MLSKKDVRALIEKKLGTPIACSNFVRLRKKNTYSQLESYSGRPGIYRFIGPEGVTLYVGTSGYGDQQGLKERVAQNFTSGNTGGTFRQNLAAAEFNDNQANAANWILKNAFVQMVETPALEHSDLEKIAIDVFEPKYNS